MALRMVAAAAAAVMIAPRVVSRCLPHTSL
jgi:hypothetical protein